MAGAAPRAARPFPPGEGPSFTPPPAPPRGGSKRGRSRGGGGGWAPWPPRADRQGGEVRVGRGDAALLVRCARRAQELDHRRRELLGAEIALAQARGVEGGRRVLPLSG